MSIEKTLKRNIDRNKRDIASIGERLITPSREQMALTEKWILPYGEMILDDVRALRADVDRTFLKDMETRQRMRFWELRYPTGLCQEIRDAVLEKAKREMLNSDRAGMQMLKNFVREGGIIQRFWGIDKNMYFQNAIQVGNAILDVANDTVDHTKEPVVLYPDIAEAPIKRMETMEQFADIASTYWERDVYPNIYLPWLAPIFPVISITPPHREAKGRETLLLENGTSDLGYINMYTVRDEHLFGLSSDFIEKSTYSEKRLPEAMFENLFSENGRLSALRRQRPHIFKLSSDPEEALDAIRRFHYNKDESNEHNSDLLREYADEAAEILHLGNRFRDKPIAFVRR